MTLFNCKADKEAREEARKVLQKVIVISRDGGERVLNLNLSQSRSLAHKGD